MKNIAVTNKKQNIKLYGHVQTCFKKNNNGIWKKGKDNM